MTPGPHKLDDLVSQLAEINPGALASLRADKVDLVRINSDGTLMPLLCFWTPRQLVVVATTAA